QEIKFGWKIVVGSIVGFFGAALGSVGGTQHWTCPFIDYDLALLFQPMLMLGISIGVAFNVMFTNWMVTVLLIILFLGTAAKALMKGIETWKKETMMKKKSTKSPNESFVWGVASFGQLLLGTLVPFIPTYVCSYMQSAFPAVVKIVIPFAPLFVVLAASLLACNFILWASVFSESVVRLKASMVAVTLPADLSLMAHAQTVLSREVGVVIISVLLVHIAGFFVG
ncbi:unnamed protein product, partial [Prunus brigantina]